MSDEDSNSGSAISGEGRRTVLRWRLLIVGLAFLLPLAAVAVATAMHPRPAGWVDFALVPLMAVEFNWPFFVLAAIAGRQVASSGAEARSANAALAGGLIGLVLPYLPIYALMPGEMAGGGGAGPSLVLPILAWIACGPLSYLGFKAGRRISSRGTSPTPK